LGPNHPQTTAELAVACLRNDDVEQNFHHNGSTCLLLVDALVLRRSITEKIDLASPPLSLGVMVVLQKNIAAE